MANGEDTIDIEITEEYRNYLDSLFQYYQVEGDTLQEKIAAVEEITGMSVGLLFQQAKDKEERRNIAFTPLGLPREMVINAGTPNEQVVATYDYLKDNTNFVPYIKGDATDILDGLTTDANVRTFQQKLLDAGYLRAGAYVPGFLGQSTTDALNNLLADSNNAGRKYNSYLDSILLNPKYDASMYPTEPELDYNELGNTVINTVKKQIGREPTKSEYDILLSLLAGYKTTEYKEGLEALGPQYKEVRKTLELSSTGGPTVTVPTGVLQKTELEGFVTPSNAEAKFQSKVNELFKPEMDFNQRREQTRNVANIIKSSVAGLRSIGG